MSKPVSGIKNWQFFDGGSLSETHYCETKARREVKLEQLKNLGTQLGIQNLAERADSPQLTQLVIMQEQVKQAQLLIESQKEQPQSPKKIQKGRADTPEGRRTPLGQHNLQVITTQVN